jgi:MSHA pilin protein MshC
MEKSPGFTVVELIIVIVLIGIVGAVAFARYMSGSAFNAAGAQDAVLTIAHAAQQAALGRSDVSFVIDATGGEWVFSAVDNGNVLRSVAVSTDNVILETGSAAASASTCASGFDTAVANDFALTYNSKGDLVDFTNNSTTEAVDAAFNGVRICVNDTVVLSVCVSPAGYAYEGDCDD